MKGLQALRAPLARPAAVVTAAALLVTLTGCMTVHGEKAVIPAVGKDEAAKVLKSFTARNNRANTAYDARLNAQIESGALGAIDQAGLTSRKKVDPKGNPDYNRLELTDTRYLIPKQAGWPKFFATDSKSNRKGSGRWFFVFQRDRAHGPWKASYLSVLQPDEIPQFARDKDGYVKPVPTGGDAKLAISPGKLSRTYTRYLQEGTGDEFAGGPHTSALLERREKQQKQTSVRNEFVDQAAQPPQFVPFGLRTKDGGGLVFFASHHHHKQTLPRGYTPKIKNPLVKALMTGKPKQSVTFKRVSSQVVSVPAEREGGETTFLNRIEGLTAARGE
ncbi:hypothetical protein NMN56_016225 [Streptomyces iconiensis]|uniref:DUF8094 domain-containing protein n=1 Tax=Streptomyces iconiensis TaxID=1384038 RepID=A0ABT6ZXW0_9ACTN|nr:hypothetical protein [Streptomyces iconiensis]